MPRLLDALFAPDAVKNGRNTEAIEVGPNTLMAFSICFFPIVVNTTQGLLSAEATMAALLRMYGATRWQDLRLLRLPVAMPYFLAGLRIAATLAPIGAIFGEYLVGNAAGGSGGRTATNGGSFAA